jgi:serine protease Do
VLSALGRSIADLNNHVDLLQTDAAMNPGNSGGPLLNSRGEVIGINTVVRSNAQNIGFAVPVDVVRNVSNQLLAHGDIKRPFIGIFMEDMNTALTSRWGIDHGVVILRVVPGSPAGKAGVAPGDVIIKLNETAVETSKDARANLQRMRPGDVLDFTFFRKGTGQQHRKVMVGDYPYE